MGQGVRFLKIKKEASNQGECNVNIESVCNYLKSQIKENSLDSDDGKLREELFEDEKINFIINASNPEIAKILSDHKYLLGKQTSIYLVDLILWGAIEKCIKKDFSEMTFSDIAKNSKKMEEIEIMFKVKKLAIEVS